MDFEKLKKRIDFNSATNRKLLQLCSNKYVLGMNDIFESHKYIVITNRDENFVLIPKIDFNNFINSLIEIKNYLVK